MARQLPTGSDYERLHELEITAPREPSDRLFRASTTLWAHRRFLGAVLVRSAVLVAVVSLLLPPVYECKTELMPPDQQSGAASMLAALMGSGGSGTGSLTGGPGMTSGVMGMAR